MLKVNNITALKFAKSSFYTFNILTFFFVLVLTTFVAALPGDPVNGFDLSIGAIVTTIISDSVIASTYINSGVIALYVLLVISVAGSIISFLLIRYKFVFDSNNYTWMSVFTIVINFTALLVLTEIIFSQNITMPIDLKINQPNATRLGIMFKYTVQDKMFHCTRSAAGISCIVYISFELFIMFINWLYFSFKIIKHKYINY